MRLSVEGRRGRIAAVRLARRLVYASFSYRSILCLCHASSEGIISSRGLLPDFTRQMR